MHDGHPSFCSQEMVCRKVYANSLFLAQFSFVETEKELCFHRFPQRIYANAFMLAQGLITERYVDVPCELK